MRVLIVEDSERLRRSLAHGLEKLGWGVDTAADGVEALTHLRAGGHDVVVLDLLLPRLSGLEVLRLAREEGLQGNVLVLSALDQISDRVRALDLGADDYLVKPFSFEELHSRLQVLVRRRYQVTSPRLAVDGLMVDLAAKKVTFAETVVPLTAGEFGVLELLLLRRGRVLSQAQVIDQLYGSAEEVSVNAVEVVISGLRRKLRSAGAGDLIQTRRGFGYVIE